jgi:hypothetical protein
VRGVVVLLLAAGCETEVQQPTFHMLTQTDANALVSVTTEVAMLIAMKQASGDDDIDPLDIPVDEDFTCASGTGHMMGVGHYVPFPETGYGRTTFEVTVSLDNCAFGSSPVSAESLFVRGPVLAGEGANSLTFRGIVTWPPTVDECAITLKIYGPFFETFDGTVCAGHVTPETVQKLPP